MVTDYSGGDWNSGGVLPSTLGTGPSGGGHGWFGSITDPLGLVSSFKNLATGFAMGAGKIGYGLGTAAAQTGYNLGAETLGRIHPTQGFDASSANWTKVARDVKSVSQGVGDMAFSVPTMAESLAATAALPLGGTHGVTGLLERDVFAPFNKWVASDTSASADWLMTPGMRAELYGADKKGMIPQDFITDAEHHGIGAGVLNTALQVATVAAPVESASDALLKDRIGNAPAADAAASEVASYDAKVQRLTQINRIATQAAHPITTGARAGGQLVTAFREMHFPAILPDGTVAPPVDTNLDSQVTPHFKVQVEYADGNNFSAPKQTSEVEVDAASEQEAKLIAQQMVQTPMPGKPEHIQITGTTVTASPGDMPQEALVGAVADTVPAAEPGRFDALNEALKAAVAHVTGTKPLTAATLPKLREGDTRLYRVGDPNGTFYTEGAPNEHRATGTAVEDLGRTSYVDVPKAVVDQLPKGPNGEIDLAAALDSGLLTSLPTPTEYQREAAPAEAKVEPGRYAPGNNTAKVGGPEARAINEEQLRDATSASRTSDVVPDLVAFDDLGQRLATPTPTWANWIASKVPPSMGRLIGKYGHSMVTAYRMRDLYNNLQQVMVQTQRMTRNSPVIRSAVDAAVQVLSDKIGRQTAEARVGEEIIAQLNGSSGFAEWAKNHEGVVSPEQEAKIDQTVRGSYKGVTPDLLKDLTPEEKAAFWQKIADAVDAYRSENLRVQKLLLASRYGAKGLEQALLGPDEVGMTPEQVRLYKRSLRDITYADKAKARTPDEVRRATANAEMARATAARRWGVVDTLRAKLGLNLTTVDELFRGIPEGLKDEGRNMIAKIMGTLSTQGGGLFDIGAGASVHPDSGIWIDMADQFDVPLADFPGQAQQLIHDALMHPKDIIGNYFDPQRLWGGQDARLAVRIVQGADGQMHVVGTIGQHTIGGEGITPGQAHILGLAHERAAGFNFRNGEFQPFGNDPNEQTLAKYYVGHVLNPKSDLNRWLANRSDIGLKVGLKPEEVNAEMMAQLWLDRRMSELPDGNWKPGDIFNVKYEVGKNIPTLAALFQTIMPDLSLNDHVMQALTMDDAGRVNDILAWYYKSHDFIEAAYRDKWLPPELGGRNAAEVFYDVLALSSVMASPTQNLGRALMGFAHLDEFLGARQGALEDARAVIDEALGGKISPEVVYVVDLGKDTEHVVPKAPKGQTQQGTPVASRWLYSEARPFSEQLSMTTGPKYRIIDALFGRFNLESATAEDIGGQPEHWNGTHEKFSDVKLDPQNIVHHAELLGIQGPELDAFKQWAVDHARIKGAWSVRSDRTTEDYHTPISDSEDVQRKRAEADAARKSLEHLQNDQYYNAEAPKTPEEEAARGLLQDFSIEGGREVSLGEYQDLADEGQRHYERATADSSPHVLGDTAVRDAAFASVQDEWGGMTIDAHTGQPINPDTGYAVTARAGQKETTVKIGATKAQFDKAYTTALTRYKETLDSSGGHLGVFRNEDTGNIEIDPVYVADTPHQTEAIGAYHHSNGGAYNYATGNGYWVPHVLDDEVWSNKTAGPKAVKASWAAGMDMAKSPVLRQAYENALMEYHGSNLLAKLRSFRDNLAHPHESLAVTLDSIMAQLFGYEKTFWGKTRNYAMYADKIREAADYWSQIAGRQIMPHEIQALLWVYAKRSIGGQDWARLQAHAQDINQFIDTLEQAGNNPKVPKRFDPFQTWWTQELEFSRQHQKVRTEREALRAKRTAGTLTGAELNRLDVLEAYPDRMDSTVHVLRDGKIADEIRHEGYYDGKVLKTKNAAYIKYLREVAAPIEKALNEGRYDDARKMVGDFVTDQKRSILNGMDGRAFGWGMTTDPKSVSADALRRMSGEHMPSPNPEAFTLPELFDKFNGTVKGATILPKDPLARILIRMYQTGDVSTLLHEDLHAFRLHAPGDMMADFHKMYPHIDDALKRDGTVSKLRVADEERFVSDFMGYLRSRSAGQTYTGPLADIFNRVAATIDEHIGPALNTATGKAVPDNVVAMWDRLFAPDIKPPKSMADPLKAQQAAEPPKGGTVPRRQRWESDAQYAARRQRYGEARGDVQVTQRKIMEATQRAQHADRFANKMAGILLEPTKSQVRESALRSRAGDTLDRLSKQLEDPTNGQVPRQWRPYYEAVVRLRDEIAADPSLAELAQEIPENFGQAMRLAAEMGFDPVYVPELTYDVVQKYLSGHLNIGTTDEESIIRRESTGSLARRELAARNIATLGTAFNIAMREQLTSRLLQFIEENYARRWNPNMQPPDGWSFWTPARDRVVTGRHLERGINAVTGGDLIVPTTVVDTLRAFERPQWQMPNKFRFVLKGPPMQVWKHLFLTFSPTWYIKHFIGSVTLATIGGARWQDWRTAIRQFRTDTLPSAALRQDIMHTLDEQSGGGGLTGTIISRNKITDFPSLIRSEGLKVAAHEVVKKMDNIVATVDSISRAAVYASKVRTGETASRAAYMTYEALGDFNRLGPIERSFVTSVIPFYSFQKAMFRVLMRLPVNHPVATAVFMQLGMMHQAYVRERLGGDLPDNYLALDFTPDDRAVKLDKLNPLTDTTRMLTLDGIVQSASPVIRILASEALHAPSYNAEAQLDANGNLVPGLSLADAIKDTYTAGVPGMGQKAWGRDMFAVTHQLSDKQYASLLRRIKKYQNAKQLVDQGGYLTTDAYAPAGQSAPANGNWNTVP